MKEKFTNFLFAFIAAAIFIIGIAIFTKGDTVEASTIGQLAEEINALQDKKQECYDNLTYQQSEQSRTGKERFCYEWDDEILNLRAKFDELTYHPYMSMGL